MLIFRPSTSCAAAGVLMKEANILPKLLVRPATPAGCLFQNGLAVPTERHVKFYKHKPPLMTLLDGASHDGNKAACYITLHYDTQPHQRGCFCQMIPDDDFIPEHPEGLVIGKKTAIVWPVR
jgi:hypothetical protein